MHGSRDFHGYSGLVKILIGMAWKLALPQGMDLDCKIFTSPEYPWKSRLPRIHAKKFTSPEYRGSHDFHAYILKNSQVQRYGKNVTKKGIYLPSSVGSISLYLRNIYYIHMFIYVLDK
jgi:hypothetical protein